MNRPAYMKARPYVVFFQIIHAFVQYSEFRIECKRKTAILWVKI